MNDLAFRKQLQINPQQLDEEILAYLEQHPQQKKVVQRVRNFDTQIKETLNIEVPEGLHARILLNQSYQDAKASIAEDSSNDAEVSESKPQSNPKREARADKVVHFWNSERIVSWAGLSGMAASLMILAVSISLWQSPTDLKPINGPDMVAHILEHIEHDPTLMTAIKLPKTEADMQALFATVGASLHQPIEQMSYAGECVVEGQAGLHIVM